MHCDIKTAKHCLNFAIGFRFGNRIAYSPGKMNTAGWNA
jgi:hypothetical protein